MDTEQTRDMILQEEKIIFYKNEDSTVTVDVYFADENFWLAQKTMAALFDADVRTINEHLKNIYATEELEEDSTIRNFRIVQKEGTRNVQREIKFYNLDAIIAIGYRVNSKTATQFRRWATQTLKEYIIKGFVLNDQMLKNGKPFGKDYFDELLEKIREVRASERRAYQKITDIFEQCSSDYQPSSQETKTFYAFIQNKLHYAITNKTAAEIIHTRVDSTRPKMGLTTWKNTPDGKIFKSDVKIAKNYLNQEELDKLNRIVTMFIDFAEMKALDHVILEMKDWVQWLDKFLAFNDKEILQTAGRISREMAMLKAEEEYSKYRVIQDQEYISYFDKELQGFLKNTRRK